MIARILLSMIMVKKNAIRMKEDDDDDGFFGLFLVRSIASHRALRMCVCVKCEFLCQAASWQARGNRMAPCSLDI